MDHHCPWINNCVGHRNFKYYLQFLFYVVISALYLSLLMIVSFYQLLCSPKPKIHMNQPWYPQVFIGSIVAFVMGLLMAYFCYEVLNEEFEAIEYNQGHVDSE